MSYHSNVRQPDKLTLQLLADQSCKKSTSEVDRIDLSKDIILLLALSITSQDVYQSWMIEPKQMGRLYDKKMRQSCATLVLFLHLSCSPFTQYRKGQSVNSV